MIGLAALPGGAKARFGVCSRSPWGGQDARRKWTFTESKEGR